MYNHLLGKVHRQNFVEEKYKRRHWPFHHLDLSRSQLLEIAKDNAENNCNLGERIKTRKSDEVFMERISPSDSLIFRHTQPGLQEELHGPQRKAALAAFLMAQRRTMARETVETVWQRNRGTMSACPTLTP